MSAYRHAHHGRGISPLRSTFTDDFNRANTTDGIGNYTYYGKRQDKSYFNIQSGQCVTQPTDGSGYQSAWPKNVNGTLNEYFEFDLLATGSIAFAGLGNLGFDDYNNTYKPTGLFLTRNSDTEVVFDYFMDKTTSTSYPNYPSGSGNGVIRRPVPAGTTRYRIWRNTTKQIAFGYVVSNVVTTLASGITLNTYFDNCTTPMLVGYSNNSAPAFDNLAFGVYVG